MCKRDYRARVSIASRIKDIPKGMTLSELEWLEYVRGNNHME